MNDLIFISDFDGTITEKDFYWILLDDYIGKEGIDYYYKWKENNKIGTEFLNRVFSWHKFSEIERMKALEKVSVDKDLEKVIGMVEDAGGEFMILSAGFNYYIDDALKRRNLNRIKVVTNNGGFRDGCFIMEPDEKGEFYSPVYGVNKESVAKYYKGKCNKLIFAGDSEPDYLAALQADLVFAKNELAHLMDLNDVRYYKYENFDDIRKKLSQIL